VFSVNVNYISTLFRQLPKMPLKMVSQSIPIAALVLGASAMRSRTDRIVAAHSPYNTHSNMNCYIQQGGQPVDPEGDPPQPTPITFDECMAACDTVPTCVGVTHQNREHGLCYLRKAVDTEQCQSNGDYNTYTNKDRWVDPNADVAVTCGDLSAQSNLLCAKDVKWAFLEGKWQNWAHLAYKEMHAVSGVHTADAVLGDFQRLSYCVNFRNSKGEIVDREDPCAQPPCSCTNPPCDVCPLERAKAQREKAAAVTAAQCPQPPDNGGCADDAYRNRYCPSTQACHADHEAYLCPVGLCAAPPRSSSAVVVIPDEPYGYKQGADTFGHWGWCVANAPLPGWNLNGGAQCNKGPAVNIKVLTYNLFWWNLFGLRHGMWKSAGKLIRNTGPYDVIGFQECDDIHRVVDDTGIGHEYGKFGGLHAVSSAWHMEEWEILSQGVADVAEDSREQWYGRRGLVWIRIRHRRDGAILFFANHHGPLPVGYPGGGFCGPEATAYNILKVIGENAHKGDSVILVGDFNAVRDSRTQQALSRYLNHQYQGSSFIGVDNFYSNDCAVKVEGRNIGNGGSDHDALSVSFTLQR